MSTPEINLDAWSDEDLDLLSEAATRLAPETEAIAARWTEELLQRTSLSRFPESFDRVNEINRWFLGGHLLHLQKRSLRALLQTNFDGDVALLLAQLDIDRELRSTLSQLYSSLEISTGLLLERMRALFADDPRLPKIIATYARLALQLAETVGLAFYEVRSSELRNALRAASSLVQSSRELNTRAASLSAVLTNLTEIVTRALHCDRCLVFFWHPEEDAYAAAAQLGFSQQEFVEIEALRFRAGDFPMMDNLLRGEIASGTYDDGRVPREMLEHYGALTYAVAPMTTAEGGHLGTLAAYRATMTPFDRTDVHILEGVAQSAALAIGNARLVERLESRTNELVVSNDELEKFAYVASHDLQEPLRTVASFVQLLANRYRGKLDRDADEFIGFTVDGVVRMQALIRDLLAYSRVGRTGKEATVVETEGLLEDARRNLASAIEESHAVVTHDPLPAVLADGSQLVQLFQNLIGNAIKFRGEAPPCVHVSAQKEGTAWRFSVADNGIGIDPQYADRLFVIFQRLHGRDQYPGTGIGLAICKKIVERQGGRIWFEGKPGEGTTFYFTLPIRAAPAADGIA